MIMAPTPGLEPGTNRLFLKSPESNGTYFPMTSTAERSAIELGGNININLLGSSGRIRTHVYLINSQATHPLIHTGIKLFNVKGH